MRSPGRRATIDRREGTFSTDLVAAGPHARLSVALASEDPGIQPTVDIDFNGRWLTRYVPSAAPAELRIPLPSPYSGTTGWGS